jgi:hypothetical protein
MHILATAQTSRWWAAEDLGGWPSRGYSAKRQMWLYHMPVSPLYISNSVPNFSSISALCLSSTIITIIFLALSFLHPECTNFNLMFTHNRIMSFTFVLMQPTSFFKLSFLSLKFSTLRYNIWVKLMSSF